VNSPAEQAAVLATEALAALGRLRTVWPWLAQARTPGTPGTLAMVERRISEAAEHIEAEQVLRDRRAKLAALCGGSGWDVSTRPASRGTPTMPPGTHPGAARIGPIKARVQVARQVGELARYLAAATEPRPAPAAVPATVPQDRYLPCPWCAGTGRALKPDGWVWAWPAHPVSCPLCAGWGAVCGICRQVGPCQCDTSDEVMAAALRAIGGHLRTVTCPQLAATAAGTLTRADETARRVLGLGPDDHRVIKAPCPACGRRELCAEVSSPNRDEWSAVCRSRLCVCRGPGCGCGLPIRWQGRRHRWLADQMWDLAERLGVTVPGTGRQR
jgi:hypothetical protein